MIPELGQFALILALVLAGGAGVLRHLSAPRAATRAGWPWCGRRWPGSSCWSARRSARWCTPSSPSISRCCTSPAIPTPRCPRSIASPRCGARTKARCCCGPGSSRRGRWRWPSLSRNLPASFASRVMGVLGFVSFGFLLFTLATSNPFERLLPAPADGRDLNPVLQDPALAIHPPMLYMGYVGFAVAFAFACAAMLEGKLDQAWARWTRPWTTMAWCVPLGRHRARQLVGVLRARLGRLLVLGSGGERLVHALAGGHRADPFAGGHREARPVQELDAAARHPRVLAELVRHVPGALGRAGVGAFVRGRSRRAACSSSRSSSS